MSDVFDAPAPEVVIGAPPTWLWVWFTAQTGGFVVVMAAIAVLKASAQPTSAPESMGFAVGWLIGQLCCAFAPPVLLAGGGALASPSGPLRGALLGFCIGSVPFAGISLLSGLLSLVRDAAGL